MIKVKQEICLGFAENWPGHGDSDKEEVFQ